MGLPSHNGRQCEADALPVFGEVLGKARESVLVEGEDRACSKASHTNCRNAVKKINLDVANFQPKLKH